MQELSEHFRPGDTIVPSSSGAAETVAMQALQQKIGTTIVTTKGLASMGYGLGGAIGCAVRSGKRVWHIEGDGGFAQNLQDLGTVSNRKLPIKTFILCNDGYASIRMTQKSYFNGHYIGCDIATGLGLPRWKKIFEAFDIPVLDLEATNPFSSEVVTLLDSSGPAAFLVPVDPNQTYYPKITSQISNGGSLISNPIHLMTPALPEEANIEIFTYLKP
jgi:acetolactate synthase-1/2/3 large subunit